MIISGTMKLSLNMTGSRPDWASDGTTPVDPFHPTSEMAQAWADEAAAGAAINKAEVFWHDRRTLTDADDDVLELRDAAGAEELLLDAFNTAVVFTAIKAIWIHIRLVAGEPGDAGLIVGAGAVDPWLGFLVGATDTILIPPGGTLYVTAPTAAGWVVGAGDLLKLLHNGGGTDPLTYDILLLGRES